MAKTLAAFVLAALLIAGGAWWMGQGHDGAARAQTATASPAELDPALLGDRTLGKPDAPIKIVEYASFTCPHCATFHTTVFKKLKSNYIDSGKVFYTYREVYFDRFGLWAGMIARCSGNERYFGFVDTYYVTRDKWLNSDDPAVVVENLKRIGKTAGMSDATLDQCLNNKPLAESLVATFEKNMAADGIEGTPTILIDGEKNANMSYEELAAILDEKLAN